MVIVNVRAVIGSICLRFSFRDCTGRNCTSVTAILQRSRNITTPSTMVPRRTPTISSHKFQWVCNMQTERFLSSCTSRLSTTSVHSETLRSRGEASLPVRTRLLIAVITIIALALPLFFFLFLLLLSSLAFCLLFCCFAFVLTLSLLVFCRVVAVCQC